MSTGHDVKRLAIGAFLERIAVERVNDYLLKKTLNNAGHIDAKLIDFSEICQKNSNKIGCFLLILSRRSSAPKFPVKSAIFPRICPPENPAKFNFFPRPIRSPALSGHFSDWPALC